MHCADGRSTAPLKALELVGEPSSREDVDWHAIVRGIRDGDSAAMGVLYEQLATGLRYFVSRQLGSDDVDDHVHQTIMAVVVAIQHDEIHRPECLAGFARTVARRCALAQIRTNVRVRSHALPSDLLHLIPDKRPQPEEAALAQERVEWAADILKSLPARQREILHRFYVLEQPQAFICAAMGLTETQFRLLKSRAKGRFGRMGQRKLTRLPIPSLSGGGETDSRRRPTLCVSARTGRHC